MSKRIFVFLFAFVLALSFIFGACTPESGESSSVSDNSAAVESSLESSSVSDDSSDTDEVSDTSISDESNESSDISSDESDAEIKIDPKYADEYERDRKIYTDYLLNTKYENLGADGEEVTEEFSVKTRMIDLDGDGQFELLIITRSEDWGMRVSLLAITDGNPTILITADHFGGSAGGESLVLAFDTKNDCYAVNKHDSFRNGGAATVLSDNYYTVDTKYKKSVLSTETVYFSKDFDLHIEDIERIKSETDLYEENSEYIIVRVIDDEYVTKEDFDSAVSRFIAVDESAYKYHSTAYNEPIISWEDITK